MIQRRYRGGTRSLIWPEALQKLRAIQYAMSTPLATLTVEVVENVMDDDNEIYRVYVNLNG